MLKNKSLKLITILFITILLSVAVFSQPTFALISQNVNSWYTISDTNVAAMVTGDVNGDNKMEIVTAGYNNDGNRWVTQLSVWNGSNIALENVRNWYWNSDTQISSVAVANITGSSTLDIVTGGSYFDGTRWIAQLSVWNGSSLALENIRNWYWNSDTQISSVAVANITGSSTLDIVTGGSYFDGTRWIAQLSVWNASTLAIENVRNWYWNSNTYINSIATADIYNNSTIFIITGGTYFDGTRNVAQLSIWNGTTLALSNIVNWYWNSNTEITSVGVANITGGSALDIVTGGNYFDNTNTNAQLTVWNGSTLAVENVVTWLWTSNTQLNSLIIGNYTGGSSFDILTAGQFNDGVRNKGQLMDWNSTSLSVISTTYWFSISDTQASSVALGNFGIGTRVVSAGSFFDGLRSNSMLIVWG